MTERVKSYDILTNLLIERAHFIEITHSQSEANIKTIRAAVEPFKCIKIKGPHL